jgi:Radical SAM superfamily
MKGAGTLLMPVAEELGQAERLKFALLEQGLSIDPAAAAHIDRRNRGRPLTPADYASTSGVILRLDGDVWVNAPIARYNPNFVADSELVLSLREGSLIVRGAGFEHGARLWLPPAYHGQENRRGEQFNSYAFTHGDRVRIAPIEGCAMACHFCDLPYSFRYRRKRVDGLVESVARAVSDEIQPAAHALISGGTPRAEDFDYVNEVYEAVIGGFPQLAVDVMMAPVDGLLDLAWLDRLGLNEISINIEIYNREIARRIMRRKHDQGFERYLAFIESAAEVLGGGRVRSMLLVGIEPLEDTLAGVRAIAERGCQPVLSPFRPDPATPMANAAPPNSAQLEEAYLRAREIAAEHDVPLGPSCAVCAHNTMTLPSGGPGEADRRYGSPLVV